jgi:hypothetical protein
MDELEALILSTGVRIVMTTEPTLDGKTRELTVQYVSPANGTVVETWEYTNDPMDRAWGAIKSVSRQVIVANDMNILEVQKQRRYGNGVLDDFFVALKSQGLTTNQKLTLFNTLYGVVTLCLAGELRAAKAGAETINNTTLYTAARQTWLVNRIQEEIDKLN